MPTKIRSRIKPIRGFIPSASRDNCNGLHYFGGNGEEDFLQEGEMWNSEIGNSALMADLGIDRSALSETAEKLRADGQTAMFGSSDRKPTGVRTRFHNPFPFGSALQ